MGYQNQSFSSAFSGPFPPPFFPHSSPVFPLFRPCPLSYPFSPLHLPLLHDPLVCTQFFSEGPKGGRRKGGRGRKLSHFSFCCAFRCCVVYSPCFPVWGEEKVMTIYDAGPLAAGPLCGLLIFGLPRKQKIGVNQSWVRGSEI